MAKGAGGASQARSPHASHLRTQRHNDGEAGTRGSQLTDEAARRGSGGRQGALGHPLRQLPLWDSRCGECDGRPVKARESGVSGRPCGTGGLGPGEAPGLAVDGGSGTGRWPSFLGGRFQSLTWGTASPVQPPGKKPAAGVRPATLGRLTENHRAAQQEPGAPSPLNRTRGA